MLRPIAAILAAAVPLTPAAAQDGTLEPSFGVFSLTAGFLPDPNWIALPGGGDVHAEFTDEATGDPCTGHFAEPPDFRLFFVPGADLPLTFHAWSDADTVLLVKAPDGAWYCNDDHDGVHPQISFAAPREGQYDIWIGTFDKPRGDYPDVTLSITETEPVAGSLERAFFGRDDRVEVDASRAPWSMIGLLEAEEGYCSGVLIGPDVVLTAAHCLAAGGVVDMPPESFSAGYDRGRHVARSAVSGYHVPEDWLAEEANGSDFAFVYLADPIGNEVGWMEVSALSQSEIAAYASDAGPDILQAGYSFDREGVMTGHLDCAFVEIGPDSTLVHQCDTLEGDSGSPLFVAEGGRFRVIGIESHTEPRPREAHDRNVATYADAILAELRALGLGGARLAP
ncbi:MAG: trypsin-like serine peptidase [Roseicyclus sp.]